MRWRHRYTRVDVVPLKRASSLLLNPARSNRLQKMTMRNFWRPLLCLLILAGFMTTSFAQTVTREGLTDTGWTGLRWWLDVNADGKDDFCELTGGSQQYLDCYMSTGSTFAPMQRFTNVGTGSAVGSAKWADVN